MFTNLLTEKMLSLLEGSWCALHFDDPSIAGQWASELTGSGYTRANASMMATGSDVAWNLNPIVFRGLPGGKVTHVALWDAPVGGSLLAYAPLTPYITMIEGGTFSLGAQQYAVSIGRWAGAEDASAIRDDAYDTSLVDLLETEQAKLAAELNAALAEAKRTLNLDLAAKLDKAAADYAAQLDKTKAAYDAKITALNATVAARDKTIATLNATIASLQKQLAAANKPSATPPPAPSPAPKPSVEEIARQVIRGEWGNAPDRYTRLTAAGHDWKAVQNRVNEILGNPKRY